MGPQPRRKKFLFNEQAVIAGIAGGLGVGFAVLGLKFAFPYTLLDTYRDFFPVLAGVSAILLSSLVVFARFLKSDTLSGSDKSIGPRIAILERQVFQLREDKTLTLTAEERAAFREKISKRISEDLRKDTIKAELAKIVDAERERLESDPFDGFTANATARLTQQIDGLGGRANLNLFIGLMLAVSGVGFLIYYVQTTPNAPQDFTQFMVHFLPRISLVTIIELISYFFLRLYKQAVDEIKYFQNEITNIEMKVLAATITRQLCPAEPTTVISALASTERNFLIPKDQRLLSEVSDTDVDTAAQRIINVVKELIASSNSAKA